MTDVLWDIIAFLVALAILIAVHEFGHFWVARRCGVKVERFSLGFGKVLLRWRDKQDTEYVISLIPLGGYVKMLDERAETVPEELRHRAFTSKSTGQRAAIIAAGPLANFIFALFAYWCIFMAGIPAVKPVIEQVQPDSIAARAGLQSGMELKSIAGDTIDSWDAVSMTLIGLIGKSEAELGVAGPDSNTVVLKKVDLRDWQWAPDKQSPLTTLGIVPVSNRVIPTLTEVQNGSAAQQAGLQVGDKIVKIEGKPLQEWGQFVKKVHDNPGKPLQLSIERAGSSLSVTLIPAVKWRWLFRTQGFAGVLPEITPLVDKYRFTRQYGPLDSFTEAIKKTCQMTQLTVDMIAKLITGDVKLNALSGPISIAQGAGVSAQYGVVPFMLFLALISINLGVINLFPLPVLDGGHLLFLLIEKIKGTPVSEQVQEYSYRVGVMVLLLLMGLALFNDFSRL